jgi:hypothetical protein
MKQVIDSNNQNISGLYRKSDNSLVVLDNKSLTRSIAEKNRVDTINELTEKVDKLEKLVLSLLNR